MDKGKKRAGRNAGPKESKKGDPAAQSLILKNEGNKFFKAGRHKKAIDCFTRALMVCPEGTATDRSILYQNRAASYEKLGRWQNVVDDCTEAIKLDPRYVKALSRRANAIKFTLSEDRDESCIEDIEKLQLALDDAAVVKVLNQEPLSELFHSIKKDLGILLAKHFRSGEDLRSNCFINEYFEEFLNDPCCKAAEQLNDHTDVSSNLYNRALMYLRTKEYSKVLPTCTSFLKDEEAVRNRTARNPNETNIDCIGARLLRGTFLMFHNKFLDAELDFDCIIANPVSPPRYRSTALIRKATGLSKMRMQTQRSQFWSVLEEAQFVDPENSDTFFHKGKHHKTPECALTDLEIACELSPNSPELYAYKLYMEFKVSISEELSAEEFADHSDLFEMAIDRSPRSLKIYSLYAELLGAVGQHEKAIEICTRGLAIDSDHLKLTLQKGLLLMQWKREEAIGEARILFEKILSIEPKWSQALSGLGQLEFLCKNYRKAHDLFLAAIYVSDTDEEKTPICELFAVLKAQINGGMRMQN